MILLGISRKLFTHSIPLIVAEQCYEKLLKDWTKDIPEIQVQGKQIRIKNEYLKDIHLQNNEIELELL